MCLCLGACIVKYILTVVNLILTLVGLAITAIGVVILVKLRSANVVELNGLEIIPTIIIVIGCVITFIFFLGCCGAITRNACMLISYSVIIVVVASLTVAVTVLLSKNTEMIEKTVSDEITNVFNQQNGTGLINLLESSLECCGTTGPDSYSNIPRTCCPDALSNLQNIQSVQQHGDITSISTDINDLVSCNIKDAYQDGCVSKFTDTLNSVLRTVVTILICICISEYVAGAMAVFLTCYIRRKKN